MSFKYSDAGRSKSKRPHQKVDCTVRSLALTCNLSYDQAYDILKVAGRVCSKGFDIERWLRKHSVETANGEVYFRMAKVGRKPGATKLYRLSDFLHDHPEGKFIVATAGHVLAVIQGVAHDDSPNHYVGDRPVYGWMMVRYHLPGNLMMQANAIKAPIHFGGRFMSRPLGLVSGSSGMEAKRQAVEWYAEGLRKGETVSVKSL